MISVGQSPGGERWEVKLEKGGEPRCEDVCIWILPLSLSNPVTLRGSHQFPEPQLSQVWEWGRINAPPAVSIKQA